MSPLNPTYIPTYIIAPTSLEAKSKSYPQTLVGYFFILVKYFYLQIKTHYKLKQMVLETFGTLYLYLSSWGQTQS